MFEAKDMLNNTCPEWDKEIVSAARKLQSPPLDQENSLQKVMEIDNVYQWYGRKHVYWNPWGFPMIITRAEPTTTTGGDAE